MKRGRDLGGACKRRDRDDHLASPSKVRRASGRGRRRRTRRQRRQGRGKRRRRRGAGMMMTEAPVIVKRQ